jgi:hypothetical protein
VCGMKEPPASVVSACMSSVRPQPQHPGSLIGRQAGRADRAALKSTGGTNPERGSFYRRAQPRLSQPTINCVLPCASFLSPQRVVCPTYKASVAASAAAVSATTYLLHPSSHLPRFPDNLLTKAR